MQVSTGHRCDLPAIADLMNRCCLSKRRFSGVTASRLEEAWDRGKSRDALGLVLVKKEAQLIGASHGIYDSHDRTGYISFMLAAPGLQDQVWPLLLSAVEKHLSKARVIRFGSPHTPLYQAAEGRFKPLWGSTEVLEVNSKDLPMLEFLELNGYKRQHEHVTMTRTLENLLVPASMTLPGRIERLTGDDCWYNAYSWYGKSSSEEFGQRRKELRVVVLRRDHNVLGHIAWYPIDSGMAAVCDLEVARTLRGRGLGKYLLHFALIDIREAGFQSVELHTSQHLSPVGYTLYHKTGFCVDATWIELAKRLRAQSI